MHFDMLVDVLYSCSSLLYFVFFQYSAATENGRTESYY